MDCHYGYKSQQALKLQREKGNPPLLLPFLILVSLLC